MVGRDARVRVMDFGLARASGAGGELPTREDSPLDLELTRTGGLLGTPAYMPPEQFHGRLVDARSDQFAFCVALWEALYGERPFAATSLSELIARVDAGEVSPIPRGAAAPAWLRRVLLRGLRPDDSRQWAQRAASAGGACQWCRSTRAAQATGRRRKGRERRRRRAC